MKQIFTKTQAVSILVQVKAGQHPDLMKSVDPKHNLFNQSCEALEKKLSEILSDFAGVVDDPIISNDGSKTTK